ncbi:2-nitropropane dioxygenase [Fictibacillus macauensis ZFHKF-1]|uniref:Probable nitronate monooxygenase n=1 Tax=Fictibacillus macauensis ZFHKF-1 TaxID=1196324 RepID=I8UDR2_9BACL|nr:nitronate monooxygenase [Fictibacillus macauensis]EIT84943.1 2-nitropropane dioxygenase [Fictibacillus macauensis ZFHKF-1]
MQTRVTQLLNIDWPIIQGGLAYLAYAKLAAAVSNAGGLGQITAMSLPSPEALTTEIRRTKALTNRPFGVNFAISQHGKPYEDMMEAALHEKVDVISITGGNPAPVLQMLQGTGVKTLVLVSSVRQAIKAEALGADAVMAVGQEGGGHLGKDDVGTICLIPRVVEAVSIPVIASGGIGDGKGFMAALSLGAEGIEMGTRFIATQECEHAHPLYKEALINGTEQGTVVIKRSIGAPARAIASAYTKQILEQEKVEASYDHLKEWISGERNQRFIYEGKEEEGFGWAGQVMGQIFDSPSVQQLFERIQEEMHDTNKRLQDMLKSKEVKQ